MAPNPNPGQISNPMWWLAGQLLALAPGTQLGGIYANKAGYHNTGDANEARWPGDYSIRDARDRRGPSWRTKAAAIDWTFPDAQRGDYRRMAVYGARLRAGYDTRDPRLGGWREALGQTDPDAPPEGLDFRGHYTRVPDDTHRWHWHFSEDREQVENLTNKAALLSVLKGQTLTDWQTGGTGMADDYGSYGRPAHGVANRTTAVMIADMWWQDLAGVSPYDGKTPSRRSNQLNQIAADLATLKAAAVADEVRDNATRAAVEALKANGGVDVAPAVEAIRALRDEALHRFAALETQLTAVVAERDELRGRLAAAAQAQADVLKGAGP